MDSIRAVLIDDEEPARVRLRGLLAGYDDLEIVGEACDGPEAMDTIEALRPDLVFLDIQMPGMSGLEVAASLSPPRPRVIFCTAFDQYAIEAFEHHAADYLLKPVNKKRLVKAVDRVRAGVAEQRAQGLRAREVEAATRAQERLLPRCLPPMAGLDYAGACRAARGVGGDYYDFLSLDGGRLGIALGDVSGKGMSAGLLVAGLQARIQSIAPAHGTNVANLAADVNRTMHASIDTNRYATLFYAVYDDATQALRYVNAGHNPPLIVHRNASQPTRLPANGTPVGLLSDARYEAAEHRLQAGDIFVLYSDGVTEALDGNDEEFGETRLLDAVRAHADLPATDLRDRVLDAVAQFAGAAQQHDDISLVIAKARDHDGVEG